MVVEKGLPRLRPRSPALRHVLGDHRLSDLNAKLEQFAVNARRTSQRIGQAHLSYQAADLAWYSLNFTAGIAGVEPAAEAETVWSTPWWAISTPMTSAASSPASSALSVFGSWKVNPGVV